ncbi:hypothetical protein PR048_012911 [Dryococelus australis]|uniref:DDE Tnp4 domain-containing protein n=1 Tax=Dryococelus australis TaxID=614101 RepID=A0ABQ9HQQ6_9NEOP|nr:hypothetical protein PR048_012911 [Dryococelus australis]
MGNTYQYCVPCTVDQSSTTWKRSNNRWWYYSKYILIRKTGWKQVLNLPTDEPLSHEAVAMPYMFLGDDAFALSIHMLKLYPGIHDIISSERVFIYRLSCAQRIV